MELSDVWNAVTYVRNDKDEIIAAQVPIDKWRFLLDHVQQLEDMQSARERLSRLRGSPDKPPEK